MNYYLYKIKELFKWTAIRDCEISSTTWIGCDSYIFKSQIDEYTYLGNNCICLYTQIGKFCSIANNCTFGGAEHPLGFVSTSPIFYGGYRKPFGLTKFKLGDLKWNSYRTKTIIENDVWIGNNVIVKAGVKISNGSVIAAGSVVTKDVPPYEIWGGNPAKFIKKRFSRDICEGLLESQWWLMSKSSIIKYSKYMNNPMIFLDILKRS